MGSSTQNKRPMSRSDRRYWVRLEPAPALRPTERNGWRTAWQSVGKLMTKRAGDFSEPKLLRTTGIISE